MPITPLQSAFAKPPAKKKRPVDDIRGMDLNAEVPRKPLSVALPNTDVRQVPPNPVDPVNNGVGPSFPQNWREPIAPIREASKLAGTARPDMRVAFGLRGQQAPQPAAPSLSPVPLKSGPSYPTLPSDAAEQTYQDIASPLRRTMLDPRNGMGSNIGIIGPEKPVGAPLPRAGMAESGKRSYSSEKNLNRIANSGGSEAMFAQNALAGKGPPPIASLPNNERYTGEVIDSLKNKLSPDRDARNLPRLGVNQPDVRSGSNTDTLKIALNRMRSGSSLNRDEQAMIDAMPPDVLAQKMAGSVAARKAASQEVLRERGLQRGADTAAKRSFQKMTRPSRNGQTFWQPGLPEGVAAARVLGGGGELSPMQAAIARLVPPGTAAAFNDSSARERSAMAETAGRTQVGLNETASREQMGKVAIATTMMQSEDPMERARGEQFARSIGMNIPEAGGPGAAGNSAPLKSGELPTVPLTNDQGLQIEALNGNRDKIRKLAESWGLKPHEVERIVNDEGASPLWDYSGLTGITRPKERSPFETEVVDEWSDWFANKIMPKKPPSAEMPAPPVVKPKPASPTAPGKIRGRYGAPQYQF